MLILKGVGVSSLPGNYFKSLNLFLVSFLLLCVICLSWSWYQKAFWCFVVLGFFNHISSDLWTSSAVHFPCRHSVQVFCYFQPVTVQQTISLCPGLLGDTFKRWVVRVASAQTQVTSGTLRIYCILVIPCTPACKPHPWSCKSGFHHTNSIMWTHGGHLAPWHDTAWWDFWEPSPVLGSSQLLLNYQLH